MIILPSMRAVLGVGGGNDPYWSSVVQMAHFDGTPGSTTFTNSAAPRGSTLVQQNSNGALSSGAFKFGGTSFRNISNGGAAETTNITDYTFGTGDFTVEFWVNIDTIAAENMVYINDGSSYGFYVLATGQLFYLANNVNRVNSASGAMVSATWYFISYSRIGTTGVLSLGGVSQGSWTDNLNYTSGKLWVGRTSVGVNSMTGYVDDFRVTKGVGRYTAATYAVPTAPFPNQ